MVAPVQRSPTRPTRRTANNTPITSEGPVGGITGDALPGHLLQDAREGTTADEKVPRPPLDNRLLRDIVERFGDQTLKEDGSNMRLWLMILEEVADDTLLDRYYYESPCPRNHNDSLARTAIIQSCASVLRQDLYRCPTSFEVMQTIKARFNTVSRAAQKNKWIELTTLNINVDSNPTAVASQMRAIVADLSSMNLIIGYDSILGLIFDCAVAPDTPLSVDFNHRVEQELMWNNGSELTFDKYINLLTIAIMAVRQTGRKPTVPQIFSSSAVDEEPETKGKKSGSVISHEDNIYIMASGPGPKRECFRCKSTSHLISQCPMRERATPFQRPPSTSGYGSGPYRAYYPVLAPSGPYLPEHFQRSPSYQPPPPVRRMDSYRPDPRTRRFERRMPTPNSGPPVATRFSNIDMNAIEFDDPHPDDMIFDTGATHHLTGENERRDDFSWTPFNDIHD